jgi:hypothetical protein
MRDAIPLHLITSSRYKSAAGWVKDISASRRRKNRMPIKLSTSIFVACLVSLAPACSDDHDHHDDCGAHGHAHGDHCDCDEGYLEVGGVCVSDCGGFGDWHDGHCDCDEGYVEEDDTCVPEAV